METKWMYGEKEGGVKHYPRFPDWTSKTVVPFSEMGTKGRRKTIC